ncbi:MAG: exodeoxyribonuclease VII large subunit [Alphaproteobacteria bacterium]|nr:exodeoxyribonuclease VII large subunit [Alphaproteobacteria bacterium]
MEEEFSVSRLAALIKRQLEINFSDIKLIAEVSAVKTHFSGHVYFSLKDENAVIDAVCWKQNFQKLNIELSPGQKIVCHGSVSSYPKQSKYQFIVEKIETAGIGNLLQLIEERKKKLASEGLFDLSRKKKIPRLPKTIGVITSPTGAVIQDILHRIRQRFPSEILLWPVLVQGTEAKDQIASAIDGMNNLPRKNRPDVLIVARGGGSFEDLMPFNEECVVRSVARSQIPIISAIGHETDTTLIDYAADLRAPTPTAAAEFAVPEKTQLQYETNSLYTQISSTIRDLLKKQKLLLQLNQSINFRQTLNEKYQSLDFCYEHLRYSFLNIIQLASQKIDKITIDKPNFKFNIDELFYIMKLNFASKFEQSKSQLTLITQQLESNSYINILNKGFALVETSTDKPVTSLKEAIQNYDLKITFADGSLEVIRKPQQTNLF